MSSSYWKKYGGQPQNHSTYSEYIKAGNFKMVTPYDGTFSISGVQHTEGDIVATHNIDVGNMLSASAVTVANTTITKKLITEELELDDLEVKGVIRMREGSKDPSFLYLYSQNGNMQVTHDVDNMPHFLLDVHGDRSDMFRAATDIHYIHNHLAETGNKRGIVAHANEDTCTLGLYGSNGMDFPPSSAQLDASMADVTLTADGSGSVLATSADTSITLRAGTIHVQPYP